MSLLVADSPQAYPHNTLRRGKGFHSQITVQVPGRVCGIYGFLSVEVRVQCRRCHIQWQMQQCREEWKWCLISTLHLYWEAKTGNSCPDSTTRMLRQSCRCWPWSDPRSLHQKSSKILPLRHILQVTPTNSLSLKWVRRNAFKESCSGTRGTSKAWFRCPSFA